MLCQKEQDHQTDQVQQASHRAVEEVTTHRLHQSHLPQSQRDKLCITNFQSMFVDVKEMFPTPTYLDNNMIIAIESGEIAIAAIDKLVGTKNIIYGYSDAHIYETDTRQAFNGHTKEELVRQRLNTIAAISKDQFFNLVNGQMSFNPFSPFKRYEILKPEFPNKEMIMAGFTKNMPFEARQVWREKYGFADGEVNNQPVNGVMLYIVKKLEEKGISLKEEFKEFAKQCGATKKTLLYYHTVFMTIKLEMAGYSKEKKKKPEHNPDFPSMWDAEHIACAAYCDKFISMDNRCCDKAEVIYHTLGIPTNVIRYSSEK